MKMNAGECHPFVSANKHEHMCAKIGNDQIWESRTVKLLGIAIDSELKFDEYIITVCKKAQKKLTVLTRIKKYLDFNSFNLYSQFKYCPLTWMSIVELQIMKQINYMNRSLRLVYDDFFFISFILIWL